MLLTITTTCQPATDLGYLLLAAPLYALMNVRMVIDLSAMLELIVAVAGLFRFGLAAYTFSSKSKPARSVSSHPERSEEVNRIVSS